MSYFQSAKLKFAIHHLTPLDNEWFRSNLPNYFVSFRQHFSIILWSISFQIPTPLLWKGFFISRAIVNIVFCHLQRILRAIMKKGSEEKLAMQTSFLGVFWTGMSWQGNFDEFYEILIRWKWVEIYTVGRGDLTKDNTLSAVTRLTAPSYHPLVTSRLCLMFMSGLFNSHSK